MKRTNVTNPWFARCQHFYPGEKTGSVTCSLNFNQHAYVRCFTAQPCSWHHFAIWALCDLLVWPLQLIGCINCGGLVYIFAKSPWIFWVHWLFGLNIIFSSARANVPQPCVQTSQPVWSLSRLCNTNTRGGADLLLLLPLDIHPHTSGLAVDWYWTLESLKLKRQLQCFYMVSMIPNAAQESTHQRVKSE